MKLKGAVTRSNKILNQLFPVNIRDRILADGLIENKVLEGERRHSLRSVTSLSGPGNYSNYFNPPTDIDDDTTLPIADLFLNTTVFYGDIVGKFRKNENV
jgi:hypothetical protein